MAGVKKGTLTAPQEWWKHLRWVKRCFWKRERKAYKSDVQTRLVDDYTHDELMADICTLEHPCDYCVAAEERRHGEE